MNARRAVELSCDVMLGESIPPFGPVEAFPELEASPGQGAPVSGWERSAQVLVQELADSLLRNLCEAARVEAIERELHLLRERLDRLEAKTSVCVPIVTLAPEPFDVLKPFYAVVQAVEDEYVASFFDANLNASGATEDEAFANLKDVIVMACESLMAHKPSQLGPGPAKQLAVLNEFVRRRE